MWLRESDKASVRASTLAELLVVMVVTSILLLAVTDGLTLFGRYSQLIMERITRNIVVWENYCRLESLVVSADSLQLTLSGEVEIYREGETAQLSVSDSVLLFSRDELKDTLFHSVVGIDVPESGDGNDSLLVFLSIGEGRLRIAFSPRPKPEITSPELCDLEEKYRYE